MSEKIPYEKVMGRMRMDIDYIAEEAYQKGYDEAKLIYQNHNAESDYQRGLDDAWEAARKLFLSMADSDIEKAFPIEWNNGGFNALMNLQPQEAIAKLQAYEQKRDSEIKVGDEVDWRGDLFFVTNISSGRLYGVD